MFVSQIGDRKSSSVVVSSMLRFGGDGSRSCSNEAAENKQVPLLLAKFEEAEHSRWMKRSGYRLARSA